VKFARIFADVCVREYFYMHRWSCQEIHHLYCGWRDVWCHEVWRLAVSLWWV